MFELIGHAGADWGSGAQMVGYNYHAKVSVAYAQATMLGMNCSLKEDDYMQNFSFEQDISCRMYDLALQYLS
jgi:hypothetical protein